MNTKQYVLRKESKLREVRRPITRVLKESYLKMKITAYLVLGLALFVYSEACSVTIDNKSAYSVGWTLIYASAIRDQGNVASGARYTKDCNTCLPRDLYVTWNNRNCYLYLNCIDRPTVEVNIYPQAGGQWRMSLRNHQTGETSFCNMPSPDEPELEKLE
ncbi:unnamed protein product [Owenia fusiformis]|uniref:Uncharacterized protein n=1 Tax=Owenia fusiformis TaxID=6347 RepID=A0A8S4NTH3_OWEFU|nr:unnamed protein product [Owenia fusiformis]